MILVDVVVVASLVLVFLIGVRNGLCAGLSILVGTIAGGVAAATAVPLTAALLPAAAWSAPLVITVAAVLVGLGAGAGFVLGRAVRRRVDRTPLRIAERWLGGAAATLVGAVLVSFAASALTAVASPATVAALSSSRVLQAIGGLTPPPVSAGMAQLRGAFLDAGLSRWAAVVVSPLASAGPALDVGDPDLLVATRSVVRISGAALACGRSVTGSGFVLARDRVVTNAHVVAGVDLPLVTLADGTTAEGRVVHVDRQADLAVIAVDGLPAAPLRLASDLATGASAVVAGYPHGGPLDVEPSLVLWRSLVTVPGVAAGAGPPRDVYALDADVSAGSSGGPMLTDDGRVAGLVFARGADGAGIGYAMTDAALRTTAVHAAGWSTTVDTGGCAG